MDGKRFTLKNNRKLDYAKYAIGGVGFSMTNQIVIAYLTFFCTDIFGVSSLVVAGLMLVTKTIDAVTDPIMGFIADHTRTKLGSYRPYLIFGSPVLGFLIYLLFSSPDISAAMKVVFLYLTYIGYSLAFTVVGVPFMALVPVITNKSGDRTIVVSWKSIMVQVGRMIITTFSLPIVELLGGGAVGWRRYGGGVGIIITLCFWCVAWGAKKYDTVDLKIKKPKFNLRSDFHLISKNKPLLLLMVAFSTDVLANASLFAVNVYYFKYVLHRQDLVPAAALALTITGVIANILLPALNAKIDKKKLYWFGTLLSIIPLAILLFKPVVPVYILMLLIIIFGFISIIPSSLAWSMLPDCIDYSEYVTGVKGNGIVSSTFSFANKLGMAVGSSAASFMLGLVGFVANQEQTATVMGMIVFLRFGIPILGYIISLISMHFYELTDERNKEIRAVLNERKRNVYEGNYGDV